MPGKIIHLPICTQPGVMCEDVPDRNEVPRGTVWKCDVCGKRLIAFASAISDNIGWRVMSDEEWVNLMDALEGR